MAMVAKSHPTPEVALADMVTRENSDDVELYVRTLSTGTVVTHRAYGHFLPHDPTTRSLILANETSLTTYRVLADGRLVPEGTEHMFGLVTDVCRLRGIRTTLLGNSGSASTTTAREPLATSDLLLSLLDSGILRILTLSSNPSVGIATAHPNSTPITRRLVTVKDLVVAPPGLNPFHRTHRLCVDPLSRAFVAGALKNSFQIFLVSPEYYITTPKDPTSPGPSATMSSRDSEFSSSQNTGLRTNPSAVSPDFVRESRIFTVPGTICAMTFLHPHPNEKERVLLAMMVMLDSPAVSLSLYIYEFWTRNPALTTSSTTTMSLLQDTRHYARLPFPKGSALPYALVALPTFPEAFLLVNQQEVLWIDARDAASGNVYHTAQPLPRDPQGRPPLVVSTDVVTSSNQEDPSEEMSVLASCTVYLTLATQQLLKLVLQPEKRFQINTWSLDTTPGQGLTILASCPVQGDVLFMPGDMGDHAVVCVTGGESSCLEKRYIIPNYAPVNHCVHVANPSPCLPTMWMVTGCAPSAQVRALQWGIPTTLVNQSEPVFEDVRTMWDLEVEDSAGLHRRCLVLSYVYTTRTIIWSDEELRDGASTFAVDTDHPTIFAGTHLRQWLIQITREAVRGIPAQESTFSLQPFRWSPTTSHPYRIAYAQLLSSYLLLVMQVGQCWKLTLLELPHDPHAQRLTVRHLDEIQFPNGEPSAFYAAWINGRVHGMVGFHGVRLSHFTICQDRLILANTYELAHGADATLKVLHGLVLLRDPHSDNIYLVISFRDGYCAAYLVTTTNQTPHLNFIFARPKLFRLGQAPSTLVPSKVATHPGDLLPTMAWAYADRVYQIGVNNTGPYPVPLELPGPYPRIIGLTPYPNSPMLLTVLVEGQLLTCKTRTHTLHARNSFGISVTPKQVYYDDATNTVVVTGYSPVVGLEQVQVLDPHTGEVLTHQSLLPQEQIYCSYTWTFTDKRTYRYFCVGTGIPQTKGGSPTQGLSPKGRVVMYTLKRVATTAPCSPSPTISTKSPQPLLSPTVSPSLSVAPSSSIIQLKFVWDLERPGTVTRMASFGSKGLLLAINQTVCLLGLNTSQRKMVEITSFSLDTPVRTLDTNYPYVSVASVLGPLQLWRFDIVDSEFRPAASSGLASHICQARLLSPRCVLASGQFGGLVGYYHKLDTALSVNSPLQHLVTQPTTPCPTLTGDEQDLALEPSDVDGLILKARFGFDTRDTIRQLVLGSLTGQHRCSWYRNNWDGNVALQNSSLAKTRRVEQRYQFRQINDIMEIDDVSSQIQQQSILKNLDEGPFDPSEELENRNIPHLPLNWVTPPATQQLEFGASLTGALYGILPIRYPLYRVLAELQVAIQNYFHTGPQLNNGLGVSFPLTTHLLFYPTTIHGDILQQWFTHCNAQERQDMVMNNAKLRAVLEAYLRYTVQHGVIPFNLTGDPHSAINSSPEEIVKRGLEILEYILTELDLTLGTDTPPLLPL
ncbi:hypothetical protein IWQ61_002661 [Dispira simplex]|nr:hypothetical protein IWQ61_002661 [Dispira simplex]